LTCVTDKEEPGAGEGRNKALLVSPGATEADD
jgi:hypothetical protein